MGNRLSKIYTRTGDDGSTGLGDGARVAKESLRVEAYGSVDETNSAVGLVLAVPSLPDAVKSCLTEVQHDLFDLGGELCIPGHRMITPRTWSGSNASSTASTNRSLPSRTSFCPAAARPRPLVTWLAPSVAARNAAAGRLRGPSPSPPKRSST